MNMFESYMLVMANWVKAAVGVAGVMVTLGGLGLTIMTEYLRNKYKVKSLEDVTTGAIKIAVIGLFIFLLGMLVPDKEHMRQIIVIGKAYSLPEFFTETQEINELAEKWLFDTWLEKLTSNNKTLTPEKNF